MKYRIIMTVILVLLVGGLWFATQKPETTIVSDPASTSDDNAFKGIKIQ